MTQLLSEDSAIMIVEEEMGMRELMSNLTIIGSQPNDTGVYLCQAENAAGTAEASATLDVYGRFKLKSSLISLYQKPKLSHV